MQRESDKRLSELHWTRHADRYLALVHAELEKHPDDPEMLELLHAMQAAVARQGSQMH